MTAEETKTLKSAIKPVQSGKTVDKTAPSATGSTATDSTNKVAPASETKKTTKKPVEAKKQIDSETSTSDPNEKSVKPEKARKTKDAKLKDENNKPASEKSGEKPKRTGALSNFSAWSDMCKKHGQTGVVTKKNPKYDLIKKEYDELKKSKSPVSKA